MNGGNYIKEGIDPAKSTCLIFSPKEDEVGALAKALKMFEVSLFVCRLFRLFVLSFLRCYCHCCCCLQKQKVNLLHIESRSSSRFTNQYEFMVECAPGGNLSAAIETLRQHCSYFSIISRNHKDNQGESRFINDVIRQPEMES